MVEGRLVGSLAWPGHCYSGCCLLPVGFQHLLDCGISGEMVYLVAAWHAIVNGNAVRYLALLAVTLVLFSIVISFIGQKPRVFIPAFIFVFVLSTLIYIAGNWDQASHYNLEPPLVALVLGLIISNLIGLPRWLDAGFRVEFYIKLGIVAAGRHFAFLH